jgi:hypothetical protein
MDKKEKEEEEKLKRGIVDATKVLKRKYKELKHGRIEETRRREETFQPVVEPLKQILKQQQDEYAKKAIKREIKREETPPTPIKMETSPPDDDDDDDEDTDDVFTKVKPSTSKRHSSLGPGFLRTEPIAEYSPLPPPSPSSQREEEQYRSSIDDFRKHFQQIRQENPVAVEEFLNAYEPLPRQYLEMLISDTDHDIDYTYGVHYNPALDAWELGKTPVKVEGKDLIINNITYTGTPGLYELLFKRFPTGATEKDKENYARIIKDTNLARKNFDPLEQIAGNKGHKYKNVIRPLLEAQEAPPKERARRKAAATRRTFSWTGAGGENIKKNYNKKPIEYVYWNEVSELVSRLRLLWASKLAGNTSHENEIISIIEELREHDIIY